MSNWNGHKEKSTLELSQARAKLNLTEQIKEIIKIKKLSKTNLNKLGINSETVKMIYGSPLSVTMDCLLKTYNQIRDAKA